MLARASRRPLSRLKSEPKGSTYLYGAWTCRYGNRKHFKDVIYIYIYIETDNNTYNVQIIFTYTYILFYVHIDVDIDMGLCAYIYM